ncbi:MAG: hypothetical protein SNH88_01120 [Rikenellaceae bacterium]
MQNSQLVKLVVVLMLLQLLAPAQAQSVQYDESVPMIEMDSSLFRLSVPHFNDSYGQATRYAFDYLWAKRRGLDYWIVNRLLYFNSSKTVVEATNSTKIRVVSSNRSYSFGGGVASSKLLPSGWSLMADISFRGGRDGYIEGLFRQDLTSSLTITNGAFRAELYLPLQQFSTRTAASAECYTLTGDYNYNPSWGLYHGKVRSSRVNEKIMPKLEVSYGLSLGEHDLSISVEGECGVYKRGSLGWYNAYNPLPDYYRRMPSYLDQGAGCDLTTELWQSQDVEYTQIAWDKLESYNKLSSEGEALYVVEQQVERRCDWGAEILFKRDLAKGLSISYGARAAVENHRKYKIMDDLLGAEYLTDLDQYTGDYAQVGNDMQNDLRNPNRKIYEGDRFGYDYSLTSVDWGGIFALGYSSGRLDISLDCDFGERYIRRVGHYDKERFSGNSYGASSLVVLPCYSLHAMVGYALAARHYFTLRADLLSDPPLAGDLFIQEQSVNSTIASPASRRLTSLALGYSYTKHGVRVDVEGYVTSSKDGSAVWSSYDDLSASYVNNVISNISTLCIGLEITALFDLARDLQLSSTLALGGYQYSSAPEVNLYSDVDLSLVATSSASAIKGCVVGNSPQLMASAELNYRGFKNYFVTLSGSYAGFRYIEPSILRRTDRVIAFLADDELQEVREQQRLGDEYDLSASVSRIFYLARSSRRLIATASLGNILGDRTRVKYAREGNRLLSHSSSESYYGEASRYEYGYGRTIYVSLGYQF